jgi:hypothetical protein
MSWRLLQRRVDRADRILSLPLCDAVKVQTLNAIESIDDFAGFPRRKCHRVDSET